MPLLKLDVKFKLPTYDGDLNAKNLDNWVRQLEFYCRIRGCDQGHDLSMGA